MARENIYVETSLGKYIWGDSLSLMGNIPNNSIDTIICSPPFEGDSNISDSDKLGNKFVDWYSKFFDEFERVMPENGTVAFELGGLWLDDAPGKSIQHSSFLRHIMSRGWKLMQELFYYNPQLLSPQPNVGLTRLPDSITPIWIVSRDYNAKYDVSVADKIPYAPYVRGNLLEFDTSDKHDQRYEKCLKEIGEGAYIDRWPSIVPAFLVELLTQPGQTILDPFAGSAATCHAADRLGRNWIGIERDKSLSDHVDAMFSDQPKTSRFIKATG